LIRDCSDRGFFILFKGYFYLNNKIALLK
jgi:hypothetical protein